MSAERTVPLRRPQNADVIIDFMPERVKAPFLLRCGALLIDYIVLVSIPVITLLISRLMGNDGARLLGSSINNAGWLIVILLGLTNFIVLPMVSGQTIGKMLTGLRIVQIDGTAASTGSVVLRQTLGYLLTAASFGTGFLISVLSSKGRALHDYVAGTVVIYADKRLR
ncbi:MAG: RDD family protein [Pyrinomonadaceae bacterium]|nr:RDD family protein [Blastocatellia bacterium]MDQ3219320.1 RDD family protein [Acidobacteriota bacterium]MDQ3490963.1 RDD family protein [Acidobacteriota bacterium]